MKYQLIWTGTKPNGNPGEKYIMSTHDSLSSAQAEKAHIEQIHAGYSDAYRKAFGTGRIDIVPA